MLATVEQLEARLRYPLEYFAAVEALETASDEVASVCSGVSLDRKVEDVVVLYGTSNPLLELPGRPVVEVASVEDDAGRDVSDWKLRGDRLWRVSGWGGPHRTFEVVYTHGFETPPAAAVRVVLARASRLMVNPEQVMQKRRGDYSATFGSSTTEVSGLTTFELRFLEMAGLRTSVAVW
jgi:hypothetical protein